MSERTLTAELCVPRPIDEVFAFFSDARNLELLTPPWLSFEVLTPAPIEMGVGTLIDYRLRMHGVPLRWRTEIPVWQPPQRFVDVQQKGPFRLWHHEHTFEAIDGGTRIRDAIRYQAPGWLLEPVVNWLFVRRDVRRILAYRQEAMIAKFGRI